MHLRILATNMAETILVETMRHVNDYFIFWAYVKYRNGYNRSRNFPIATHAWILSFNTQNLVLIKKTSQYFLQKKKLVNVWCPGIFDAPKTKLSLWAKSIVCVGNMSPPIQDDQVYYSTPTPVGLHGRSSLTERIGFQQPYCAKPVMPVRLTCPLSPVYMRTL